MTRTAYAQLMGQKFFPPKIFGQWHVKEGTDEWRWREVGMKIVCLVLSSILWEIHHFHQAVGFEMLYQEGKRRNNQNTYTDVFTSSASFCSKMTFIVDLTSFSSYRPKRGKKLYELTQIIKNI